MSITRPADRPNTALLVVDVQNKVVDGAHNREAAIAAMNAVVAKARAAGTPVIWVQHNSDELVAGEQAWAIVPELDPQPAEPLIQKRYGDSFEDTPLEQLLADRGVGHIVVTGAQTDFCIRSTLHGGFVRGYSVTLVGDAHTTEDLSEWGLPPPAGIVAHMNEIWSGMTAPGRKAALVKSADIVF